MSGISLRGKALWLVPVLALVGAAGTGCTIKDQHRIEAEASARPIRAMPAASDAPTTADGRSVAAVN